MFAATSIVKNSDEYVYSGYGITFDSASSQSIYNGIARDVITFSVDNSSSSHADYRINNFLMLGESPTFGIMENLVHQRKGLVLNLLKQTRNFA